MKNFHQNLLIVLALGLCALCIYQWNAQTGQRKQITTLNQLLYGKTLAVQEYTNRIATMDRQIAQMDSGLGDLKTTIRTNEATLKAQKRELNLLQGDKAVLSAELNQYKLAVETMKGKLQEAYDGVEKQNAAIKELTAQRDEFVKKFNDSIRERNEIVSKYNDLVKQMEKQSSK